jgi:hypothetical protein
MLVQSLVPPAWLQESLEKQPFYQAVDELSAPGRGGWEELGEHQVAQLALNFLPLQSHVCTVQGAFFWS